MEHIRSHYTSRCEYRAYYDLAGRKRFRSAKNVKRPTEFVVTRKVVIKETVKVKPSKDATPADKVMETGEPTKEATKEAASTIDGEDAPDGSDVVTKERTVKKKVVIRLDKSALLKSAKNTMRGEVSRSWIPSLILLIPPLRLFTRSWKKM